MASDLQKRKMSAVFGAMDANGDGKLEKADFDALTKRWLAVSRDADAEVLRSTMDRWWTVLREASDHNDDDEVTLDEVITAAGDQMLMLDLVVSTAEAMFAAVDLDGSGSVTAQEYATMIHAWTGNDASTDEVFALLDLDGNGELSKSEFARHWVEFWAGDDPDAPANNVFGLI
ncbi:MULTISPECIES: EF-hand domain-containing protein [Actinosynnema]|uniref:Calcium sensor EFh n=1 Tax=Actinosynnema pretiosum TaxID=42197 RepID=A0A290ZBX4_9PSEU|nr:EF-hand domain-containing protein [Actinosynnema pretiosum]ATE56496.1 calcium sensor EFh [Actinosynnema pretiosum]